MKVLEVFGEPILSGGQEAFVFEILKNITDMRITYIVYPVGRGTGNQLAVYGDSPAVDPVQPANGIKQCGLAAP